MRQSLTPDAVAGKDFACAAVTSHAPPGNDVTYRSDAYNIDPGFGDPGSMTAFSTSALTQQSQPQAATSRHVAGTSREVAATATAGGAACGLPVDEAFPFRLRR